MRISGAAHYLPGIDLEIRKRNDTLREFRLQGGPENEPVQRRKATPRTAFPDWGNASGTARVCRLRHLA